MIKINKKYCLLILLVFFVYFGCVKDVKAIVVLNEIQLSPNENRFIELYNNGSLSVDLTDWYIQRKTIDGANFGSLITKTNFEGKIIGPNEYFLISKDASLNPDILLNNFTITLSNTIQLKNSEGDIVDKVGWGDSNDCLSLCAPNPTENKSIQKNSNGDWFVSVPTPKYLNSSILQEKDKDIEDINTSNLEIISELNLSNTEIKNYKINTKIIAPKVVTAGVYFDINHSTSGINKEKVILGRFAWNFGDGMSKESNISEPFTYVYQYPGEYIIRLSFYDSIFSLNPDAVDRMVIKVIPSGIKISSVGNYNDAFVEIENNSNYEMSLGGWTIKGVNNLFLIPSETIILPNKKLKFSPRITGFNINDLNSITIINNSGQIFANYPNIKISNNKYLTSKNFQENIIKSNIENNKIEIEKEIINLNDLGSSVINSSNIDGKFYYWVGLIIIICIGIIAIILIRRKNKYSDYMEDELKASDMTLIE